MGLPSCSRMIIDLIRGVALSIIHEHKKGDAILVLMFDHIIDPKGPKPSEKSGMPVGKEGDGII
jgi:hypothetical protein